MSSRSEVVDRAGRAGSLSAWRDGSLVSSLRAFAPIIAGYALPFLLVLYLALEGGGYDAVVRGEVGIAVWWLVLLGAAVGALPVARVTPAGWAALGLLLAFGAWTAIGISGSESSERTVAEVGRIAVLLGLLAMALLAQGREGLRRTLHSVGAAIAIAGIVALLSRLQPGWFPQRGQLRTSRGKPSVIPPQLLEWPRRADGDRLAPAYRLGNASTEPPRLGSRGCGGPGGQPRRLLHSLARRRRGDRGGPGRPLGPLSAPPLAPAHPARRSDRQRDPDRGRGPAR